MMDDKELLELAAKSAEYKIAFFPCRNKHGFSCGFIHSKDGGMWNPFDNDGDAFQLASKLNLVVEFGNNMVVHPVEIGGEGTDKLAATRRAIVQAAAYIGMQMP